MKKHVATRRIAWEIAPDDAPPAYIAEALPCDLDDTRSHKVLIWKDEARIKIFEDKVSLEFSGNSVPEWMANVSPLQASGITIDRKAFVIVDKATFEEQILEARFGRILDGQRINPPFFLRVKTVERGIGNEPIHWKKYSQSGKNTVVLIFQGATINSLNDVCGIVGSDIASEFLGYGHTQKREFFVTLPREAYAQITERLRPREEAFHARELGHEISQFTSFPTLKEMIKTYRDDPAFRSYLDNSCYREQFSLNYYHKNPTSVIPKQTLDDLMKGVDLPDYSPPADQVNVRVTDVFIDGVALTEQKQREH